MDAEDTKERIRQLRQKVGSEPKSIAPGQAFSPLTAERLKAVKSWQSVKADESSNAISSNDSRSKVYPITSGNIEAEFEDRYQENLTNRGQGVLAKSRTQSDDSLLLEEIDLRMRNSAKEFIKFFDEKIREIREDTVLSESFDSYKGEIEGSLNKNSIHLTEMLEHRVRDVESALLEKNKELAEHFSNQLLDLTENARSDIGKVSKQASALQAILPDKVAEIENKIVAKFDERTNNLKAEISSLKDSFALRNEVIGSELNSQIDDLGTKLELEKQRNEEVKGIIKNSLDKKIDTSMAALQANMVENLSSIEGELENAKSSFFAKNDEVESGFNSKVENLDSKFGSLVTSTQANFETQFKNLKNDLGDLRDIFALRSEAIKSNLDDKFKKLESDVGDIRDSFSLRSEAMLSELNLQIGDLKQMIDLTAENAQKEDEAMRTHFDEQVGAVRLVAQSTSAEKYGEVKTELGNLRDLFALRSEAISSELGLRVDDLAASMDLNIEKIQKESESIRTSFEKELVAKELVVRNLLEQEMHTLKGEIKDSQDSFHKQLDTDRFRLKAQIEGIEQQVSKNAVQGREDDQKLKCELDKELNSQIVTVESSLNEKILSINNDTKNLKDLLEKKIDSISFDLGSQVKKLEKTIISDGQKKQDEADSFKNSFDRIEQFATSNLEKLESQFNRLDRDFADNMKVMQENLLESERRSLGIIKDKYRTLKSVIWEQLGLLKKSAAKSDGKISKIEKRIMTFDSLGSKMNAKFRTEHGSIKKYLKKELEILSTSLRGLNARILSESELQELFQNYTLNVNISRNNRLLSKTKRDFEKKNFSAGKKISKVVAIAFLIMSVFTFFKTFA